MEPILTSSLGSQSVPGLIWLLVLLLVASSWGSPPCPTDLVPASDLGPGSGGIRAPRGSHPLHETSRPGEGANPLEASWLRDLWEWIDSLTLPLP